MIARCASPSLDMPRGRALPAVRGFTRSTALVARVRPRAPCATWRDGVTVLRRGTCPACSSAFERGLRQALEAELLAIGTIDRSHAQRDDAAVLEGELLGAGPTSLE